MSRRCLPDVLETNKMFTTKGFISVSKKFKSASFKPLSNKPISNKSKVNSRQIQDVLGPNNFDINRILKLK